MIRNSFLTVAAAAVASFTMSVSGEVIASWSMLTAVPSGTAGYNYVYGFADAGVNALGATLSSSHAGGSSVYSSPAGNGSQYSFSSNNWTVGSSYEIRLSTAGFEGVSVSWDQTRSSTGPSFFILDMSLDGGVNFTAIAGYTVIAAGQAGTNTTNWNSTTNQPAFRFTFSAGASASNRDVVFRFLCTSPPSIAGTSRIDNIVVSGVPAPGALALLGLAVRLTAEASCAREDFAAAAGLNKLVLSRTANKRSPHEPN